MSPVKPTAQRSELTQAENPATKSHSHSSEDTQEHKKSASNVVVAPDPEVTQQKQLGEPPKPQPNQQLPQVDQEHVPQVDQQQVPQLNREVPQLNHQVPQVDEEDVEVDIDDDSALWPDSDLSTATNESDRNFEFDMGKYFGAKDNADKAGWWATFKNWCYTKRLEFANRILLNLEDHYHVKNWRPQLLVCAFDSMTDAKDHEEEWVSMLLFAEQLMTGNGYVVALDFVQGKMPTRVKTNATVEAEEELDRLMRRVRLDGSSTQVIYPSVNLLPVAFWSAVQGIGFGQLTPNTLLLRYVSPTSIHTTESMALWHTIHRSIDLDMCLLLMKGDWPLHKGRKAKQLTGTIDIWWILHDGGLILLLPFLLKKHRTYHECKLRIFTVAEQGDDVHAMKEHITKWLMQLRIRATVTIVQFSSGDIRPYTQDRDTTVDCRRQNMQELISAGAPKDAQKTTDMQPQLLLDSVHQKSTVENSVSHSHGSQTRQTTLADDKTQSSHSVGKAQTKADPDIIIVPKSVRITLPKRSKSADGKPIVKVASTPGELISVAPDSPLPYTEDAQFSFAPLAAHALNAQLVEHSAGADLLVLNMPRPPRLETMGIKYMQYIDDVTVNLPGRILLVRGADREVITCFN